MPETNVAPILSITVTNYNYAHLLPTCLDSILSQRFSDFEVIVIDDRSTDHSLDVIQPYLHDRRVRLIAHATNRGFVASLIEGKELSRGRYVMTIDADDWILTPDAFGRQVAILDQDPTIAFVYSAYGVFETEDTCSYVWRAADMDRVQAGREAFQELVINYHLPHTGTMVRKTAYDALGGYDPTFRYAVDVKMWLGLCHVGKAAYINDTFYAYREHKRSMSNSSNAIGQSIEEVLLSLDWSFNRLPSREREELTWLRRKAERKALTDFAADKIFGNNYRAGWTGYWMAVKIRPKQTLLQKNTLILALRTTLRQNGYRWLEQTHGRVRLGRRAHLRKVG